MRKFRNNKGFTLLELLVVLAIIGVLVSLAVAGIRIVQQVNRDTQRKVLARDIQLILESYSEKYNQYPNVLTLESATDRTNITAGSGTTAESGWSKVKFTPIASGNGASCTSANFKSSETSEGYFTYCFSGGGKGYALFVKLERNSTPFYGGNI